MWVALLINIYSVFSLSTSTWIGDSLSIIGQKTLKQITLSGTHDSGTYYLTGVPMPGDTSKFLEIVFELAEKTDRSVEEVAVDWAKSQDQIFYNQMQGGIRYFDLRSGWDQAAKQWVTFHFVIGSPVQYLLQNISQYLNDYPQEIVVVEISHFEGYPTADDVTALKNMVLSILGPYMYPVDTSFNFTINQMISSGKRAIVTMDQGSDGITIWPPSSIYNTYADSPNLQEMMNFNEKTVQTFMNNTWPGELFKVSWTLTANSTTLYESVIPWKPHTLIELANMANKALPSFWTKMKANGWRMGNILIIDHYEESQIMQVIWDMNGIPY